MFKYRIMSWLGLFFFSLVSVAEDSVIPQVIVTIKPIHALVSDVMEGVGKPHLLLNGSESPHTYSLRPSQMKQLQSATVVIWVGIGVEGFLSKSLNNLNNSQHFSLLTIQGLTLWPARHGGTWEQNPHHMEEVSFDPHIWLDPHNAQLIVQAIAQLLSELDAKNANRYAANAKRLLEQLQQLDQTLQQQLAVVKNSPFLVFHDAYQYFEKRYGLNAIGSITVNPENRPSVKRLQALRAHIQSLKVKCIFSEPQFESPLVATLLEGTSIQPGVLDPLGINITPGSEAYFELLRNLAASLKKCLLTNG